MKNLHHLPSHPALCCMSVLKFTVEYLIPYHTYKALLSTTLLCFKMICGNDHKHGWSQKFSLTNIDGLWLYTIHRHVHTNAYIQNTTDAIQNTTYIHTNKIQHTKYNCYTVLMVVSVYMVKCSVLKFISSLYLSQASLHINLFFSEMILEENPT